MGGGDLVMPEPPADVDPAVERGVWWIASAWWRDCDPFVFVVAKTREAAEQAIDVAVEEEARSAFNSDDGIEDWDTWEDAADGIVWSGAHAESLENVTITDEQRRELEADGYVYG